MYPDPTLKVFGPFTLPSGLEKVFSDHGASVAHHSCTQHFSFDRRKPLDPDSGQKSRIRGRVEMAISSRHTTSHSNRKTGVWKFNREIICKRRKTINLVIFGTSIEIGMASISDNSGASGSSGVLPGIVKDLGRRLGAGSAFGTLHPSRHSSALCTPRGIVRHSGTNNLAFCSISQWKLTHRRPPEESLRT
jgi:hypothetical protein